jgi:hypothetical protein
MKYVRLVESLRALSTSGHQYLTSGILDFHKSGFLCFGHGLNAGSVGDGRLFVYSLYRLPDSSGNSGMMMKYFFEHMFNCLDIENKPKQEESIGLRCGRLWTAYIHASINMEGDDKDKLAFLEILYADS